MRKDHRPYVLKKAYLKFQKFYTNHFLRPQLDTLGRGFAFMRPWHVELFGGPITIGDFATVIATSDKRCACRCGLKRMGAAVSGSATST